MGLIFLAIFLALATTNFAPSMPQQQNPPMQATSQKDCSYQINKNAIIKTSTSEAVYQSTFGNDKEWVLVKSNVNLPSFKVVGGAKLNTLQREMDKVGIVSNPEYPDGSQNPDYDKAFFINLGHANPDQTPVDPMTNVIVFVVQEKGRDGFPSEGAPLPTLNPPEGITPGPSDNTEFWNFNVYLSIEQLLSNASQRLGRQATLDDVSNQDVPCWMAQCRGGDLRLGPDLGGIPVGDWNLSCNLLRSTLGGSPVPTPREGEFVGGLEGVLSGNEPFPPSFVREDWVEKTVDLPAWNNVRDYNWLAGKRSDKRDAEFVGVLNDVRFGTNSETFNVYVDTIEAGPAYNDGRIYLEPTSNPTGFYYVYLPTETKAPDENSLSLQLGTFNPDLGVTYQWWYPSCKPVVYLYPEEDTSYNVALRPFGILTESIPDYPFFGGWKDVLAKPDGKLTYQGENFDYLYYEGRSIYVKVPGNGYTVHQTELNDLFDYVLPGLGLKGKEIDDFKEYWMTRLNDPNAYYSVAVLPREEIDRVEPMKVDPNPDTLIRVRLFFKKVDKPALSVHPEFGENHERIGDTVVDWGGFFKE